MNKTVVITGASSGIGRAAAQRFYESGWNVCATMRNPADADNTAKDSARWLVLPLDVTCVDSIGSAFAAAQDQFGKIDVLVNNAGYGLSGSFESIDEQQIRRQFDTNVHGLMDCCRTILPIFRSQGSGSIVNVASMGGRVCFPFYSVYNASKWAVEGFSEALQYELEPLNIWIRIVEPGIINTDFYGRSADFKHSENFDSYGDAVQKVSERIRKMGKIGASPQLVADTIFKAANDTGLNLRYPVGKDAKQILRMRRLIGDLATYKILRDRLVGKSWVVNSSATQNHIVLYDTPGSPCARRVRISLLEKGVAFRRVVLDLAKMENKAGWYLDLNPNGQVPTIVIGDQVLYESNVITEYLDALWPANKLYPDDPQEYAEVKAWQTFEMRLSKQFGLLQYVRLLGPLSRIKYSYDEFMVEARKRTSEPALLQWESRVWHGQVLSAKEECEFETALYDRLDELEQRLTRREYLVGKHFSQAEISVYPRVAMYPYIGLDISAARYPNVSAWMARLRERPSFLQSRTLVDRVMARPAMPWLLSWLDPMRTSGQRQSPAQQLALRVGRKLIAGDIMQGQRRFDSLAMSIKKRVKSDAVQLAPHPAPRGRVVRPLAGQWLLRGCPFNTETNIAAAVFIAASQPFQFERVLSPFGEEFSSHYRAAPGPLELPQLKVNGSGVDGWPYALVCIAGNGRQSLYPSDPLAQAKVQIACLGDSVVNFKYKRPLIWQQLVGPFLHGQLNDEAALNTVLAKNKVDVSTREFIVGAWRGRLLDIVGGEQACYALLEKRLSWLAEQCKDGYVVGNAMTIADIAEWLRLQESIEAGFRPDFTKSKLSAAGDWLARMNVMAFVEPWRRWRSEARENTVFRLD